MARRVHSGGKPALPKECLRMPIAGSRRLVLVVTLTLVAAWGPLAAQSVPDLLIFPPSAKPAMQRAVPARRARRTRVNPAALNSRVLRLEMFDDQVHQVVWTTVDELGEGRAVWHGQDEDGGTVLLAV